MKNMKDYEYVFNDILASFAASTLIYIDSCYVLLGPLNLSDNQMRELLEERKKDAWQDPKLQNDLKTQLGTKCKTYLSLVDKLNRRILMFAKIWKIRIELTPNQAWGDAAFRSRDFRVTLGESHPEMRAVLGP